MFAFASMFSGRRPWVRIPPASYIAFTAASSANGSLAAGRRPGIAPGERQDAHRLVPRRLLDVVGDVDRDTCRHPRVDPPVGPRRGHRHVQLTGAGGLVVTGVRAEDLAHLRRDVAVDVTGVRAVACDLEVDVQAAGCRCPAPNTRVSVAGSASRCVRRRSSVAPHGPAPPGRRARRPGTRTRRRRRGRSRARRRTPDRSAAPATSSH